MLPGQADRPRLVVLAAVAVVVVVGMSFRPQRPATTTITVAVVQGNVPELNFDYNDERRVITRNNAAVTSRLAEEVQAGSVERPDLVVWPENSSDINPYADARTSADISAAVDAIGAPTLVGALVPTADERNVQNTSIVWVPDRRAGGHLRQATPDAVR